jgi:dTDP-4-dehydrorhamnose reductase
MQPIVGLLHHGSGPVSTNLLDAELPEKFASYAAAVAARYPWVSDYTPVNEPLTTARFSGLYGHWYPHAQSDLCFAQALLNQCRAVVLAMRAIRGVNPSARLIQTEDLGKVFSTPRLAYQADFENERRWCSYDLLCGRINRGHPMWDYFQRAGINVSELDWFLDNPCPPDLLGVNHYLSGERYLDEHIDRYPGHTHGGNGRDLYADVLAARVLQEGASGPAALLREVWERYHLPIAVTECHNGCTREEQLRWFLEVWRSAQTVRQEGANVLAVTAWSLLGAFDWDSLVTRSEGHYESGVFDLRGPHPRPTAIAHFLKALARGQDPEQELLSIPGWWKRQDRFVYGIALNDRGEKVPISAAHRPSQPSKIEQFVRPVLITGGRGMLATSFSRICEARGIPHQILGRSEMDLSNRMSVQRMIEKSNPWAVVNAAGFLRIDDAEIETAKCDRDNVVGPHNLALECAKHSIQLLTFSSDLVFDGATRHPYVESDPVSPINQWGLSKVEAERLVLSSAPAALVVRTGPLFGPWDQHNFVSRVLQALSRGDTFRTDDNIVVSPAYVPELVNVCLDLLIDVESGIWHLANVGEISWYELARRAAEILQVPTSKLRRCELTEEHSRAPHPLYRVLSSERGVLMTSLESALQSYATEFKREGIVELAA